MNHVIIIGATGNLGAFLSSLLPKADCPPRSALDVTDQAMIETYLKRATDEHGPVTVINCACAKTGASNDLLFAVNVLGPLNLAYVSKRYGVYLVHVSTDYVYGFNAPMDGYVESSMLDPVDDYSTSKAAGEVEIKESGCLSLIVRTSFWTGPPPAAGHVNKYTSADYLDRIAPLIVRVIDGGVLGTINVGTERKPIYDLISSRYPSVLRSYYRDAEKIYDSSMNIHKMKAVIGR